MIMNDGGKGEFVESTPPMLGIWDTLLAVGSLSAPLRYSGCDCQQPADLPGPVL